MNASKWGCIFTSCFFSLTAWVMLVYVMPVRLSVYDALACLDGLLMFKYVILKHNIFLYIFTHALHIALFKKLIELSDIKPKPQTASKSHGR
jgi:hypothetical protein